MSVISEVQTATVTLLTAIGNAGGVVQSFPQRVDQMTLDALFIYPQGASSQPAAGRSLRKRQRTITFSVWAYSSTLAGLNTLINSVCSTVEVAPSVYALPDGLLRDAPMVTELDYYVIDEETRNSGPYGAALSVEFNCDTAFGVL